MAGAMRLKEKLAFIDRIEEFPSMPSVVLNLMSKLNDPDISIAEIEKFINMDPALVSYILRITNSLIFGLREEVYSVRRAVTLIGMSNLKSLLTSYSIRMLCKTINHPEAQHYLWYHSLAVAVLSREIGKTVLKKDESQAYVFGLLHDIGKIVLYMHSAPRFIKSLELGVAKNMDFVIAEKKLFDYSHIEAGYFMVSKLGFSKSLKDIILFHHDPEFSETGNVMVWVVSLSNELAHHLYDNKNIDIRRYLEKVHLTEDEFTRVVQSAQLQVQQYQSIM